MDKQRLNATDVAVLSFPYVLFLVIAIICINNCFFQDMIQLSSLHASWYYDNNFGHFLLPNKIDSGHPPMNGMLLASLWKVFGRSLWVGHVFWGVAAFVLIYQIQRLCRILFPAGTAHYVALVVLTDAALLTQSVLVSPDIILMAAFFTAVRAILENKRWNLGIAVFFLSLISMRGMMCTGALYFFCIYHQYKIKPFTIKRLIKASLPFVPGVASAFAFLGYHYYRTGWIGYHDDMPWAVCFQKIESLPELVRNAVVMVWRFIDSGRLIIWALLLYSIYSLYRRRKVRKTVFTNKRLSIIFLFILMLLISSYSFLLHKMLSAPRYLLPHYAVITMITFLLLTEFCSGKKIKRLAIFSSILLLSSNFVRYPEKVSVGWDTTLSHLPFYALRTQMFDYIRENRIPANDISAGFGIYGNQNAIDLTSSKEMVIKNTTHFGKTGYFIYSNISNLEDPLIDQLKKGDDYVLVKSFEKGNVFISLYKKR
ncbi:MAG: hypothetical protein LBP72_00015 [Dysgonamonadaceae bacterium]|jgi:hypothetical protein|nr:hypothetical protein [Dysgonamonadaceae bacterium]